MVATLTLLTRLSRGKGIIPLHTLRELGLGFRLAFRRSPSSRTKFIFSWVDSFGSFLCPYSLWSYRRPPTRPLSHITLLYMDSHDRSLGERERERGSIARIMRSLFAL
jgi:hypothetical protein